MFVSGRYFPLRSSFDKWRPGRSNPAEPCCGKVVAPEASTYDHPRMCLQVTIAEIEGGGKLPGASELSRASGLTIRREHGSRINSLQLFAWEKDCGCGLLAQGAPIDAEVWQLDPTILPQLRDVVALVSKHTRRFVFSALYYGEAAATEIVVSRGELSEFIMENCIRNRFRYVVLGKRRGMRSTG